MKPYALADEAGFVQLCEKRIGIGEEKVRLSDRNERAQKKSVG